MSPSHRVALALLLGVAFAPTSCRREARTFRPTTDAALAIQGPRGVAGHAGPAPESTQVATGDRPGDYEETAYAVSEGQVLFQSFNCAGCHSNGGGGMGANLMDQRWFYGHEPGQIFDTIVQGRQNGMPSFAGRIPAYQVWELVAYVRSLSGLVSPDAASGRSDHLEARPAPNSMRMRTALTNKPPPPASDSVSPGDSGVTRRRP